MQSFPEKNGLLYEVVSPFFGPHIGTNADFIGLRQKGANLGFQLDQKFLYLLSNQCLTRDSVATVKSGQKVTKLDIVQQFYMERLRYQQRSQAF